MTFAVVPAAGRSTRMGRPKLSLLLGGRSVLEHVVAALREGGVAHILVVVGPQVPELASLAEAAGAAVLRLTEATADMRATVEHGLRRLEERFHPPPDAAWLLAPADQPAAGAGVVRALLAAYAARPSGSIVVPVHAGRRGHPTVIAWRHVAAIRAWPAGEGLNSYLRSQIGETLDFETAEVGVVADLDVPEDYERFRRTW
jgi:molybdenum cofactor cytidylyltransferase